MEAVTYAFEMDVETTAQMDGREIEIRATIAGSHVVDDYTFGRVVTEAGGVRVDSWMVE